MNKGQVQKERDYFLNSAPPCATSGSAHAAWSSGSGVVAAGCKAVIGQRLKQSGMHWTVNSADSIITLRCAEASSQRETTYRLHNQTAAA